VNGLNEPVGDQYDLDFATTEKRDWKITADKFWDTRNLVALTGAAGKWWVNIAASKNQPQSLSSGSTVTR